MCRSSRSNRRTWTIYGVVWHLIIDQSLFAILYWYCRTHHVAFTYRWVCLVELFSFESLFCNLLGRSPQGIFLFLFKGGFSSLSGVLCNMWSTSINIHNCPFNQGITLFRYTTMFCGTGIISQNIPTLILVVENILWNDVNPTIQCYGSE